MSTFLLVIFLSANEAYTKRFNLHFNTSRMNQPKAVIMNWFHSVTFFSANMCINFCRGFEALIAISFQLKSSNFWYFTKFSSFHVITCNRPARGLLCSRLNAKAYRFVFFVGFSAHAQLLHNRRDIYATRLLYGILNAAINVAYYRYFVVMLHFAVAHTTHE